MRTFAGLIVLLALLGYVGHEDMKTQQLEDASATCQAQTAYTVPTFNQCIDNQLEQNGDH